VQYYYLCRVDDLYRFLHLWVPHLYGELDDKEVTKMGFELVDSDTELWEEDEGDDRDHAGGKSGGSTSSEIGELTRESWEVSPEDLWCPRGRSLMSLSQLFASSHTLQT
jgi:hypothetical protein